MFWPEMYELFRLIPETISGSKVKSEKSSRSLQENSRNAMIKNFKNFVFIPKRNPNLHILEIKLTIIKKKVYLQVLMKRVLFFLILSISLSAYSQKSIPNISLSDFEGEKTKIFEAIDENQITVISLWATWCVPCIKELDAINEVYEDWKDELDFNLLAVSVDDSRSVRRAKALVNGKSWPYEIYLDTNQDFKRALGTSFIPQTLIVKSKKILYQHTGYQPGDEDYLFEKLNTYADSN